MARKVSSESKPRGTAGKSLQFLRKEAGFRTAKEFALHIGIPPTTYKRYEQFSNGMDARIPLKAAWIMADALDCSIDMLVGRIDLDSPEDSIQHFYNHLSKSSQERFDEYMQFLQYRDKVRGYQPREGNP